MKKIICFFKYNAKAQFATSMIFIASLLIFLFSNLPILWINVKEYKVYESGPVYKIASILSIPFGLFFIFAAFLGGSLMWYAGKLVNEASKEDRRFLRGMSLAFAFPIGGFFYSKVLSNLLEINYTGSWNFFVIIIVGFLLNIIIANLLKKPLDYIRSV